MSLQQLLSSASPLMVLAAALLYFLFLYLRRDRSAGQYGDAPRDASRHEAHDASHAAGRAVHTASGHRTAAASAAVAGGATI
ncbi:MAG: hypothetical protein ABL893_11965, partial [Hyphomicrobium sp.]